MNVLGDIFRYLVADDFSGFADLSCNSLLYHVNDIRKFLAEIENLNSNCSIRPESFYEDFVSTDYKLVKDENGFAHFRQNGTEHEC